MNYVWFSCTYLIITKIRKKESVTQKFENTYVMEIIVLKRKTDKYKPKTG
jgi:hypothetical protein